MYGFIKASDELACFGIREVSSMTSSFTVPAQLSMKLTINELETYVVTDSLRRCLTFLPQLTACPRDRMITSCGTGGRTGGRSAYHFRATTVASMIPQIKKILVG